jgi:tetratricopeptide (TPR) repeat protein
MSLFRYDDAERRLKQALAIDGDFFPARRLLGDLYARQGSYDKALKEYEKALESHPGDTRLLNNMGVFLNRLERPGEASVYLQKAALLAPDDLGIRYSLASNYRDNKEWDRAVEEFRKIIAVDDEYPNIYNDLGDIYQLQGRGEEALEAFRREAALGAERLKSRPGDPRVLNDLAFALNRLGRASEAEVLIRRALKERPDYRQAYLTLAQIYENQQRHEEALAAMDKAKDLFGEAGFISENVQRIERGRSPEKK